MRTLDSISLDSLDGEAKVAISAMSDAMIVARSLEGRAAATVKPDTSPVTVADLAIHALIARRLCQDFPNDALIAEEDASLLRAEPDGVTARQGVEILAADRSSVRLGAACFATTGCSRRTVYSMPPHSKRFNARPEIACDAE